MPEVVAPNGMTALDKSRSLVLIADGKLGTRANFPRNILNDLAPGFSPEDTKILQTMIALGIETNLKILEMRSLRHRHHGLWYDQRSIMTASLLLLALVRSGNGGLIPGGLEELVGQHPHFSGPIDPTSHLNGDTDDSRSAASSRWCCGGSNSGQTSRLTCRGRHECCVS